MKGYFEQLARHTGLRFADSRASRTIAPVAPLHVEEVTMVSQPVPQATVVQTIETAQQQQPKAEKISVQEIAPAESIEHETVQNVPIEQPITLAADNTEIKHDHIGAPIEPVEVSVPFHSVPEQKVETETPHEVSEVEITDPVEREVLVRQYLREVRAWVAASPMPDDHSVSETHVSWTDPQSESVAFTVARESILTAQPESREQIDVHDMNLSIGNISIVIEEPNRAAATVVAPPPSAPPPQPQTRHEPTSLSRYYLRSW